MPEQPLEQPRTQMSNDWNDCPEGTLTSRAAAVRRSHIAKQRRNAWATVLGLCLLAGTTMVIASRNGDTNPQEVQQVSCVDVLQSVHTYFAGDLERAQRVSIQEHLDYCPSCRRAYEAHAAEHDLQLSLTSWFRPRSVDLLMVALCFLQ